MDEDIVVDFLKNDDGFEFGDVDTDVWFRITKVEVFE